MSDERKSSAEEEPKSSITSSRLRLGEMLAEAKLAAPRTRNATPRPRVFELLDRARSSPGVWLSALAGAGKSTLVASYLQTRGLPSVWYEVDARDEDLGTLYYFLGQAGSHGPEAQPLPRLSGNHPVASRAFARHFFKKFFARLDGPTCVVLDNCQAVDENERWHELLAEALFEVPPGSTLFVLSRTAPPPTMARSIAEAQLAVLSFSQLRLDEQESHALVKDRAQAIGLELDGQSTTELISAAGGWAAGLVLALECARTDCSRPTLSSLERSSQVFNYFTSEVLARAEPELKGFLLRSSVLPYMTPESLDGLLGTSLGESWIKRLTSENFFVQKYQQATTIYRYHPLFREFLSQQAESSLDPTELRELRGRAASTLAEAGDVEAALDLVDLTGSYEMAVPWILGHAPDLIAQCRGQTLKHWVDRLPANLVASQPWLWLFAGISSLASDARVGIPDLLKALEGFSATRDSYGYWMAWCGFIQAKLLASEGFSELLERAQAATHPEEVGLMSIPESMVANVTRNIAMVFATCDSGSERSEQWLLRAFSLPRAQDPEELALALVAYGITGQVGKLKETMAAWSRRAQREDIGPIAGLTFATAESCLCAATGRFTESREAAQRGLDIGEQAGLFVMNNSLLMFATYGPLALADFALLDDCVDELAEAARHSGRAIEVGNYHYTLSRYFLLKGDAPRALNHARESFEKAKTLGPIPTGIARGSAVECLWRSGQLSEAKHELELLLSPDSRAGFVVTQGALLLASLIWEDEGDRERGDDFLKRGLCLGREHGFIPVLFPVRANLEALCQRALERGIEAAYVRSIIEKFGFAAPTGPGSEAHASPLDRSSVTSLMKDALRKLQQTGELSKSPLLQSRVAQDRCDRTMPQHERTLALREIITDLVASLAKAPRTEPLWQALHHTYIEPEATQVAAAARARMSFGSYRRHLSRGIEEIATVFWLREEALGALQ